MAGADEPGQEFADKYDPAVKQALQAAASVVKMAGNYSTLLHATGTNHAEADAASTAGGGDSSLPAAPSPADFAAPAAPSAYGGTQEPDGWLAEAWHLIEKYGGLIWPRGHQDKLRATESAWKTASSSTRSAGDQIASALSLINAQQAPETSSAAQKHEDLKTDFGTVADAFSGLGDACEQYAQFIDDAHHNLIQMLKDMLRDTIIMEVIGAVAGVLSFGIGEGVAQFAVAGRIMMYVNRAREIIQTLVNAVKRVIAPLVKLFEDLGGVLAKVGNAVKQAATKVGSKIGLGKKAVNTLTDAEKAAIIKSGQQPLKNGLTRAGKSYSKHSDPGKKSVPGHLPRVSSKQGELNDAGQRELERVVNDSASKIKAVTGGGAKGGRYIIHPDGNGAVVDSKDVFVYFGKFTY